MIRVSWPEKKLKISREVGDDEQQHQATGHRHHPFFPDRTSEEGAAVIHFGFVEIGATEGSGLTRHERQGEFRVAPTSVAGASATKPKGNGDATVL
jgi:hypothetical protein